MNILLLSEFFPPHVSGGSHARYKFARIAAEEGHDIQVFTPLIEGAPRHERREGIDIYRPLKSQPSSALVPTDPIAMIFRLLFAIWLALYLPIWMKMNDIDAVHSTEHLMHPVAKFLGKLYRKPVVNFLGYTPSLYEEEGSSFLASSLESINLRFFTGDTVFCRTGETKEIIEERSGERNVEVLHGILDEEKIRETLMELEEGDIREKIELKKEERLLVFAARLTPVKAPERAVKILSKLPEEYRLVMVGDGPEMERVKKTIRGLDLDERVNLLGKKGHEDTLKYIAASDAVILTSKAEAYPTVVFEALAFNRDVFAPPVGILKELEEENLHISKVEGFEEAIQGHDLDNVLEIDERILQRYSMENYTETILEAIKKQMGWW